MSVQTCSHEFNVHLPARSLGLGLFELSPRKAVAVDASTCHAPEEVLPKNGRKKDPQPTFSLEPLEECKMM